MSPRRIAPAVMPRLNRLPLLFPCFRFLTKTVRLLLGCLLLAGPLALQANLLDPEAGLPVIRDFRSTDYLGHPQIFDIEQDKEGFIYFANVQGILQYDGIHWRHHQAPLTYTYRLAVADDGRIWASGMDALGYFQHVPGKIELEYHSILSALPDDIRQIGRGGDIVLHDGAVFVSTTRGLIRYRDGQVLSWRIDTPARAGSLTLLDGTLYWHDGKSRLKRVAGDEVVQVAEDPDVLAARNLIGVSRPNLPPLWIAGEKGVFELDPITGRFIRVEGPLDELVRTTRVNDVLDLHDGTLGIATSVRGVVISSMDGQQIRRIDRESGLADNAVLSLFTDRDGGLWAGLNSGAARIAYRSAVTVFDGSNGPTPGTIDGWFRHRGRVYAGTFDGLYRLEPPDPVQGTPARFRHIATDVTNVFAFATIDGRLVFSSADGLHVLHDDDTHELFAEVPGNAPKVMLPSKLVPDRYYIAGENGLSVLERTPSGWQVTGGHNKAGLCFTLVEEASGDVWFASYTTGFWRVPAAHRVTDFKEFPVENYHRNRGLPETMTWTTVSPGAHGTVFFTDAGAVKFDPKIRQFAPDDRYPIAGRNNHTLTPTVVTPDGATWASVFGDSVMTAKYPLGRFENDLQGRPVWRPAPGEALEAVGFAGVAVAYVDATGEPPVLWVRGYDKHVRIRLDLLRDPTLSWRIAINQLSQGDEIRALTSTQPADADGLVIPFSREPLIFGFANPRFGSTGGVKYQTRLLGYNNRWSAPSEIPQVSYTNLEGGPFILEVRALDATGAESEISRIKFNVQPPWYRRPASYALYALLALLTGGGLVRWRLVALERERHRLEELVARRTRELAGAKEEAEAANRAKSTFLANMSHELRTPLNGILGYAQIMRNDPALDPRTRERVQIVNTSGEHLLRMINEVLDFSKIEAGKMELRPVPFDLRQLLREIVVAHEPRATANQLSLALDIAPDLPGRWLGDAPKLRQILDNLVSNAVKFTAHGGVRLHVTQSAQDRSRLGFAVEDTGPGISPEERIKLFQPFHQLQTRTPHETGTGLGLAIARRLAELMTGELTLESTPGQGSTFTLQVPLDEMPEDATAAPEPSLAVIGYEGPRRRILVVDDVAINRSLLLDLLGPLGFDLREASSAAAADELLDTFRPDIALVDLRMPGENGLEWIKRRRQTHPKLAMVLMSASVLNFDRDSALAAGCDDFLPKPFRDTELVQILGRQLELEWRYEPDGAGAPRHAVAGDNLPDPADLNALLDAARRGAISELRQLLVALAGNRPDCAKFTARLNTMAKAYEMERIRIYLEQALDQVHPR